MEELKVRAWLTEEQRMVDVYEMTFINDGITILSYDMNFYTDDEFKLMQATGLKDIYDNDVYEGDILITPFPEDGLFEVGMSTTAGVYTKNLSTGNIQFIEDLDNLEELEELKEELRQYIEIKGNIYENKDLLGEEK